MDESHIRQLLSAQQWREGFEGIVVLYQEKVFHLALSMTRNSATASDMTQDALLRVWKALPLYNGTASLSTWIYTIARNVCLTELTRAKRRAAYSLDNPEMVDSILKVAAPEKISFGIEADLETLLQQLSDREQRVLRLFYLEQKSYEETAALLGCPLGTVKTQLFRARKELIKLAAASEVQSALKGTNEYGM